MLMKPSVKPTTPRQQEMLKRMQAKQGKPVRSGLLSEDKFKGPLPFVKTERK